MAKFNWDCWDNTTPITPPTTSVPPTTIPPQPPEFVCYPPRIDSVSFAPTLNIEVFFIK
jgi:hypothetical protein